MAIPAYPNINYDPEPSSWSMEPFLAPLKTEMAGGNVRLRAMPGDKVRTITQTVQMTDAEYATLDTFFQNTIFNGALRFTMNVWTGQAFQSKTVQLMTPKVARMGVDHCRVAMTLRVF